MLKGAGSAIEESTPLFVFSAVVHQLLGDAAPGLLSGNMAALDMAPPRPSRRGTRGRAVAARRAAAAAAAAVAGVTTAAARAVARAAAAAARATTRARAARAAATIRRRR